MSDFTGYLSTQVYMPYRTSVIGTGVPQANGQTSLEEELRKEIRALKGLVLNRRVDSCIRDAKLHILT